MNFYNNLLSKRRSSIVLLALLLFLLACNVAVAIFFLIFKPLDPDEFQHTHIAWNMFFNHKTIYVDFWEHHGIVNALINSSLFFLIQAKASFGIFYFLRSVSLVYMILIGVVTFLISRHFFKNNIIALLAATILSSLFFFQLKGIEIRPDVIQNLLWITGLYVLMRHFHHVNSNVHILVGVFFGLTILCNTKAGYGILFVFVFLALEFFFKKKFFEKFLRAFKIGIGIIIPHIFVLLYFYSVHGLAGVYSFFESNYLFNFASASSDYQSWMFFIYGELFLKHQITFVIASIVGTFLLLSKAYREKHTSLFLFLFVTTGCTAGMLLGLYSQFYLMFLPLLSIVAAYGIFTVGVWVSRTSRVFTILLIIFFFIPQETFLVSAVRDVISDENNPKFDVVIMPQTIDRQKVLTDYIISSTPREARVGYFWNACGGYTFNQDVQYYWSYNPYHGDAYKILTGSDAYGPSFVRNLEDHNIEYLSVMQYELQGLFDRHTRDYILANYQFINECFMRRK